jgi:hypothetical protein
VSQNTGTEEDLALTNSVEVLVELEAVDLHGTRKQKGQNVENSMIRLPVCKTRELLLTIFSQAFLPSMKPFGMTFGVRSS